MKPISFCLRGWESWPFDHGVEKSSATPPLLRRRVTPLGQQALCAAWRLPETESARLILSSRHGEFSRTVSLLEAVTSEGDLSPADFTLSVHHALIGLLSIIHKNCRGHTAVASGKESFCFGLLEAIACINENPNELVVLIHFDDLLPGAFAEFNEVGEQPLALALALSATGSGETIQIDFQPTSINEKQSVSHAHDFLDFIASDLTAGLSVSEQRQWRWTRHALA